MERTNQYNSRNSNNQNNSTYVIIDEELPKGVFVFTELLKLKEKYNEMPNSILEYSNNSASSNNSDGIGLCNIQNHILMTTPTSEAINFRQHHPVFKKLGNISKIVSEIIALLNKISADNMENIVTEICGIENIKEPESIIELASLIIKKVSIDKQYVEIYAQLCNKLQHHIRAEQKYTIEPAKYPTIISCVTGKCKEIFDKYMRIADSRIDANSTNDDTNTENNIEKELVDYDKNLDKIKVLNHIKFIGYLYNYGIMKSSVVEYCINKLLENIIYIKFGFDAVITFIKTVFDKYTKEKSNKMKEYFTKLENIGNIEDNAIGKRDKFMIQDLIEKYKLKL